MFEDFSEACHSLPHAASVFEFGLVWVHICIYFLIKKHLCVIDSTVVIAMFWHCLVYTQTCVFISIV